MSYEARGYQSYRENGEGWEIMANFVATIVTETRKHDGLNTSSVLTIRGEMSPEDPADPEKKSVKLPEVEVTAEEFAAMSWVMKRWGVRCIIYPAPGVRDDLRTMIQQASRPAVVNVYQHTGWEKIGKRTVYLHRGGGIGPGGNDPGVTVRLPSELSRFDLTCRAEPRESVQASLMLLDLARPDVMWPLFAATLAPLYGPCDFAVHVAGRTGSFKSELASLFQSHYGAEMDARHLPASWSSTGNANECLAFLAANAVLVVDDFVPGGTAWQQRAIQQQADKLFRAQGNQAGRARLTDISSLQQTMYPRGLVFSTGEDVPEGHSVRGRMLIRELVPGDIEPDDLTRCQKLRPLYCGTVAWLAQSLAQVPAALTERTDELRIQFRGIAHGRTPSMAARLVAVVEDFLERTSAAKFVSPALRESLTGMARTAIAAAAQEQAGYLEDADPVDAFCAAVREGFATGKFHVRTPNGGTPPRAPEFGWTRVGQTMGGIPDYRPQGPCVGWVRVNADELMLDMTAGYPLVQKIAGNSVPLTKATLFKRMKDSGLVARAEDGRGRNTLRVVAENATRLVACLSLSKVMKFADDNPLTGTDPEPALDEPEGYA